MGKLHLLILMVGNASTFLNGKHNNWICIYISHIFSLEFSVPYECLQFVSNNRPMENSRTLLKLFVTTVHMNKYLIDSAFTVVCPFCFFFQFHKAFLLLHCHYRCHLRFHDYFHSHWHSTPLSLWLWDTLRLCHSFFWNLREPLFLRQQTRRQTFQMQIWALHSHHWDDSCDHPTSAAVTHFFVSETAASWSPPNWHLFCFDLVGGDFECLSSSSSLSKIGLFHFADANFEAACCWGLDLSTGCIALSIFLRSVSRSILLASHTQLLKYKQGRTAVRNSLPLLFNVGKPLPDSFFFSVIKMRQASITHNNNNWESVSSCRASLSLHNTFSHDTVVSSDRGRLNKSGEANSGIGSIRYKFWKRSTVFDIQ